MGQKCGLKSVTNRKAGGSQNSSAQNCLEGLLFLDHKHNEKICKQLSVINIIGDHRNRWHKCVFRMDPSYMSRSPAL